MKRVIKLVLFLLVLFVGTHSKEYLPESWNQPFHPKVSIIMIVAGLSILSYLIFKEKIAKS
jgi:hypothetical protein